MKQKLEQQEKLYKKLKEEEFKEEKKVIKKK